MFLLLCVLSVLLWFARYRYKRRRMYELADKIPPPYAELPFFGIAHHCAGSTEDIMMTLQKFCYSSIKNGGFIRAWLGHHLYFFAVDAVDLESVLKNCLEKDELHRFLRNVIGYGGIFAPVSIWRARRKIIVPAFRPKIVENFVEVFSEKSEILAKQLGPCAGIGRFSIWPFISTYTLDSVCETVMGVNINAQKNPDSPYLVSLNKILNMLCERIFHLWLQPNWIYKFLPHSIEHEQHIKNLHDFTDDVIQKKRISLKIEKDQRTEADNNLDLSTSTHDRKTLLDLLISLSGGEKGYSNVELREEVLTLTIAGTDTSAVSVGYTLKLMAKYPEIQDLVYQELQDVFGDSDRPLEKADLTRLNLLDRVVKESLRLYPPVPFIIRQVQEELKLPSGRILPAGSGVVVSIWGIHRHPKYWGPNAEEFDPDRFLPERLNLPYQCCFMPFSSGPRNCVGYQYALMSIKTGLSSILRRFRVVEDESNLHNPFMRVKLDIMMKACDGYQIALEKRN